MGGVADGDDERVVEVAGHQADGALGELQPPAYGDVDRAGVDPFGGVGAGGAGGWHTVAPVAVPDRGGQLGARGVAGADEQQVHRPRPRGLRVGIPVHTGLLRCRLVDEPHVGPAPVGLGASPLHDPGALEHREVVGEQVGAQAEPLGDLARRGVLGGEEVDDSQSRHVRERGVPRGAGLEAAHNQ